MSWRCRDIESLLGNSEFLSLQSLSWLCRDDVVTFEMQYCRSNLMSLHCFDVATLLFWCCSVELMS